MQRACEHEQPRARMSVPPNSQVTQAKTRSDALFEDGGGI